MSKKWYLLVPLVLVAGALYFIFGTKAHQQKKYVFKKLNNDLIARVQFKNAKEKTWDIPFSSIVNEHYKSLYNKKQELIFVQAYKQFIQSSKDHFFTLGVKSLERPLDGILAQYGEKLDQNKVIEFSQEQKLLLKSENLKIEWQKINTDKVHIRALETEILNFLIARINSLIRDKSVRLLAEERKVTVQEYMSNVIDESKVKLEAEADWARQRSFYQNKKLEVVKEKTAYVNAATDRIKDRFLDETIFSSFLKLPVVVSVDPPTYDNPIKWEWTPYVNSAHRDQINIVVFADFYNPVSRDVVSRLYAKASEDNTIRFGWHPFFANNDRFELMSSELAICVWKIDPDNFWNFLNKALYVEQKNFEKQSFEIIKTLNLNVDKIKKCFLNRESKEVVDYHLNLGRYFDVLNPPVVFVGKEVFVGPVSDFDIQLSLDRQR